MANRRPWTEEMAIVDRTMRAISGITDPEALVDAYWSGVGELLPQRDHFSVSRRHVPPPYYLVTRSSRFAEHINPWTQRDRLPRLSGGLAGEIAYANAPVIIDDLPARLSSDDPAYFYLQGYQSLVALPQYDDGEGLNVSMMLLPRGEEVDRAMIPMMHWQASLFGRGTQNLVLRNQLSAALASLDRELRVVSEIQRSLLPEGLPSIKGFDFAVHYRSSARAGGDYYDFFPLPGGAWGLFIADVSGHGTPAAVLMAITRALVHAHPQTHASPDAMLTSLNEHLTRSYTRGGTFVTAFYAVLDPVRHTLTYSSAGHNPPRLVRGGRVISLDGASELPLGIIGDQQYYQTTFDLNERELLLLYTDGVIEAAAPAVGDGPRQFFGLDRLDRLLIACGDGPAAGCIDQVNAAVADFCQGAAPADDQTLIAVRCC